MRDGQIAHATEAERCGKSCFKRKLLHYTTQSAIGLWTAFERITIASVVNLEGESMGNLGSALQQLREERKEAQAHVEKLDQAISVIESLNGSETFGKSTQPTRVISQASRRKMAQAQRARWAKARKESQPVETAKTTASVPVNHAMSAAARTKIAAFQRARWAKIKAQQKKAA
jgi:hypothetical protein